MKQVKKKAAQTDTAKSRSLVLAANDRAMYKSGNKPEVKKLVSSSVMPKKKPRASAAPSAKSSIPQNTSLTGMPSDPQQEQQQQQMPGEVSYATSNARKTTYDANVSKSRDWAVMSRFESEVFAREQQELAAEKRAQVVNQRLFLDSQMNEIKLKHQKAVEEKRALAEMVAKDVAKYKAEEAKKAAERKAKEAKIKVQQEEMLVQLKIEREAALAKKKAEEEAELAETKRQLAAEKQAKLDKLAADKAAYTQAMKFNEEQNKVKAAQKKAREDHEKKVAEEYDAMLEAQERAREQAMEDFHAKIAARGAKAGEKVAENMAAKEAEEYARMQKFYNEREAALKAKEDRERLAKETATRQQMEMLGLQTRLRMEEKERKRVEMEAYYAEVRDREAKSKAEDKAKLDQRRAAAVANRMDLERQMEEKVTRKWNGHDDNMHESEVAFNLPILEQAKAVVLGNEDFY